MTCQPKRQGYKSPKYGNFGVYFICTGPDPNGPAPGERLIIVIYDKDDNIVRKLEQVKGDCLDPGYVDFFNSPRCRPTQYEYHIIDIDKKGNKQVLATHVTPSEANTWLRENFQKWVEQHGIEQ